MSESFFKLHKKLILLNIFSLCAFLLLAFLVVSSPDLTSLDVWASGISAFTVSETITSVMEALSLVFHPSLIMVVSFLGFSFLAALGRKVIATIFIISLLCAISSSLILKNVFEVVRPFGNPMYLGFAFPSTHATAIAVLLLSLLLALDPKLKDRAVHGLAVFVGFSLIFATGVSRVYLGYHFATDVIAGFALGTFWVTTGFLLYHHIRNIYGIRKES